MNRPQDTESSQPPASGTTSAVAPAHRQITRTAGTYQPDPLIQQRREELRELNARAERACWHIVGALVVLALILLAGKRAEAAEVEPFVMVNHTSDLTRGCPFACNSADEIQLDYFAPLAMTINAGKRRAWELDLSHGVKWIDRGRREQGSQLSVRYYYLRSRKFRF